jgi:GTP-binding protein HflX
MSPATGSLPNEPETPDQAIVVAVRRPDHTEAQVQDAMDEMEQLASTAGVRVIDRVVYRLRHPTAALLIGPGQADDLAARVTTANSRLILFDEELSPVQGRNLEEKAGVRVVDRTQVILDIFAQHAHTSEGRLQIELAQLEYARPRLRMLWSAFERQKGGIGLRGPGEQQLELDRRRIGRRIDALQDQLERVRQRRGELRRGRTRHGWAQICLVGYTNAGKSTLLNALTSARIATDDKLFATLDPTTRRIRLAPHRDALLTDTVGFIRRLPHRLVKAFQATLEEVAEADLLLHVVDTAHPQVEAQVDAVHATLHELEADAKPRVVALNKIDCPESRARAGGLHARLGRAVEVSARTGEGMEALRTEILDRLKDRREPVSLRVPLRESRLLALLHREGRIQSIRYTNTHALVRGLVPVWQVPLVADFLNPDPDSDPSSTAEEADPGETP